ncbi:MAG TPA: hypothetical protein VNR67_03505 [Solirubrobacterales bacterium]|nr:hypothetical protein [Solirubrobacterales bacterium]
MALLSALVLGGCGGGEATTDATAPSPSRAEFVKEANAICSEVYAKTNRLYSQLAARDGSKVVEAGIDRAAQKIMVPALTKLEARLGALGAPPGDERRVAKMLTALDEGIETAEEHVHTVRGYGGSPFAFKEAYELMWAYGLDRCGLS